MASATDSLDRMVTALVPSLSRSLGEQFNVFRVMHHGTHEKQLSNVFAWLLRQDGTHGLSDDFQRIFVERVNEGLPNGSRLPTSGFRVIQEVDTSGHTALGRDIADIVLTRADASIVVENFESSDGHGHDYGRYSAYGEVGGRQSAVVLLCARHEPHRQANGWEQAVVVTYAELLEQLEAHIAASAVWRASHQQQHFFIKQLIDHFVEGSGAVSNEDRIAFIKTMCETGESARYGHRPQEVAGQEFANLLAQHARRQFEDGRATLSQVKKTLKRFAEKTLVDQVNSALESGRIGKVQAQFQGQWEWCVTLRRSGGEPTIYLEFGPTAAVENTRAPERLSSPDYTKVFVTHEALADDGVNRDAGIKRIVETDVGLSEVLAGLSSEDTRLKDAVLSIISAN